MNCDTTQWVCIVLLALLVIPLVIDHEHFHRRQNWYE